MLKAVRKRERLVVFRRHSVIITFSVLHTLLDISPCCNRLHVRFDDFIVTINVFFSLRSR